MDAVTNERALSAAGLQDEKGARTQERVSVCLSGTAAWPCAHDVLRPAPGATTERQQEIRKFPCGRLAPARLGRLRLGSARLCCGVAGS